MTNSVLIVEDNKKMNELIADFFQEAGFNTSSVYNGMDAIDEIEYNDFDVVLLDIMMPELDGFSVCKTIRHKSDTPIIIMTALDGESDKLKGYELGADDYITKPFSYSVLVAKAKALIKRTKGTVVETNFITVGNITLNKSERVVIVNGEEVELRPKEYEMLELLMHNKNNIVSRDKMISKIWGFDFDGDERVVDKQMKNLRQKLGSEANCIQTIYKVGYRLRSSSNDD